MERSSCFLRNRYSCPGYNREDHPLSADMENKKRSFPCSKQQESRRRRPIVRSVSPAEPY